MFLYVISEKLWQSDYFDCCRAKRNNGVYFTVGLFVFIDYTFIDAIFSFSKIFFKKFEQKITSRFKTCF